MSLAWLGRHLEAHLGQHLEVERGGHRHLGGGDPGDALHGPADLEQRHRVGVRAGADLDVARPSALMRRPRQRGRARAAAPRAARAGRVADREPGRRRAASSGVPRAARYAANSRHHLAVQRAVQQGRGEQRGPVRGARGRRRRSTGVVDSGGRGAWPASRRARRRRAASARRRARPARHGGGVDGRRPSDRCRRGPRHGDVDAAVRSRADRRPGAARRPAHAGAPRSPGTSAARCRARTGPRCALVRAPRRTSRRRRGRPRPGRGGGPARDPTGRRAAGSRTRGGALTGITAATLTLARTATARATRTCR